MNGQTGRGRSRRNTSHQFRRFWQKRWKKCAAAALCITLAMGNVAGTFQAYAKNEPYDFHLSREALYEALQEAVENDYIIDSDFEFDGVNADEYNSLLEAGGDLYELKPEHEEYSGLKLRIFARLEGSIVSDEAYEIHSDESLIFMLVNKSGEVKKAIIHVDDRDTGKITVPPASQVEMDTFLEAPDLENMPGGLGAGGTAGGGQSTVAEESGENTDTEQGSDGSESMDESGVEETETAEPEVDEPDSETQAGYGSDRMETEENETTDNRDEESEPEEEDTNPDQETDVNEDSQDASEGNTEPGTDSGAGEDSDDTPDDSDTDSGSDTDGSSDVGEGNTDSDSGSTDSDNEDAGSSDVAVASISAHRIQLVMAPAVEEDEDRLDVATPSEAKADSGEENGSEETNTATPPDTNRGNGEEGEKEEINTATPSEAGALEEGRGKISGLLYEAAILDGKSVVVFETTMGDVGLIDDELLEHSEPMSFEQTVGDVTVRVYADKGVFPEHTELVVTEIRQNSTEYEETQAALESAGTPGTGRLAYDISFWYEGEEIEPDGNVEVSIHVNKVAFPENADLETLTVQHLTEQEDATLQPETVADTAMETTGTIEVKAAEAVAAFSVDSFSIFAILWKTTQGTFRMNLEYVDGDDKGLEGKNTDKELEFPADGKVDFRGKYQFDVDGYMYKSAAVSINGVYKPVAVFDNGGFYDDQGRIVYGLSEFNTTVNVRLYYEPKQGTVPSGEVTAKVYLRYSNLIPDEIHKKDGAASYGPDGNDTGYTTVRVNLDGLNEKTNCFVTNIDGTTCYYYSIDSISSITDSDERREASIDFWEEILYPNIREEDRVRLDDIGGENKYIGYVLKLENDEGIWHIDGILKEDPPVYVVEVYDNDQIRFTISSNDTTVPGVTYEDFINALEEKLGGQDYSYVGTRMDYIVVTYAKDGQSYRTIVRPRAGSTSYHVYPNGTKGYFGYEEKNYGVYFLCRLSMETQQITGNLIISKTVEGSGKNPDEHFSFTLTADGLNGTYPAIYSMQEKSCDTNHGNEVKFENGFAVINLKHNEQVLIAGLPEGKTVMIEETPGEHTTSTNIRVNGGMTSYEGTQIHVTIYRNDTKVSFTNVQMIPSETGVATSFLPYALMMAAGMFGLAGFHFRGKDKRDDE